MEKQETGSVLILVFVLAFAVIIIDERFLRTAVAFVPALLLMQRAWNATTGESQSPLVGAADRRFDGDMRGSVDELLWHIREFYLTCHMWGTGKIDGEEAVEKAAEMEMKLNRLLARVTDGAKTKSEKMRSGTSEIALDS
ncbi:hypothetical protein ACGF5M_05775 [Gemmatimonadota bacterium]